MSKAVIAGIGETEVGRLAPHGPLQIQAMAVHNALADVGLQVADLDGLVNLDPYATPHGMFATTLADYLGIRGSWVQTIDVGGSVSGMAMLESAVHAVEAGHAETIACVYGENMSTVRPPEVEGAILHNRAGGEEWEEPWGVQGAVIPYALLAQRYLDEYGASERDLGAVAVAQREWSAKNSNAIKQKPLTIEEYLDSPMVSTPLRRLDCSIIADGGGAFIVTSEKRAAVMPHRPVSLVSFAMRTTHISVTTTPDLDEFPLRAAAEAAFARAGISATDLDLAMVHDAFTISVLLSLEAMGVCEPGKSGEWVRHGGMGPEGGLPTNTHGGLLAQGHVGGMLHVVEAVRQLQGRAGARQIPQAETAGVFGNGGIFTVAGMAVLRAVG